MSAEAILSSELFKKCLDFHGHLCPGLSMGYQAATAGLFTVQLKLEASNGAGRAFCFAHGYRERGRLPAYYADGTGVEFA